MRQALWGGSTWCDTRIAGLRFVRVEPADAGWLRCRRFRSDDASVLYEAVTASIDHLRPWMPWANAYTIGDAEEFIVRNAASIDDAVSGSPAPLQEVSYAIVDRDDGFLGTIGLHARIGLGGLEIGYWIDVRHIRRGVATLAAAMVTEAALSWPEITHVEIHHDRANQLSGKIPARLGYEFVVSIDREPEAPGEVGIEMQWRMVRDVWPMSAAAQLLAEVRSPR
jgi:ribosomal-protein-serine acetyltransferase